MSHAAIVYIRNYYRLDKHQNEHNYDKDFYSSHSYRILEFCLVHHRVVVAKTNIVEIWSSVFWEIGFHTFVQMTLHQKQCKQAFDHIQLKHFNHNWKRIRTISSSFNDWIIHRVADSNLKFEISRHMTYKRWYTFRRGKNHFFLINRNFKIKLLAMRGHFHDWLHPVLPADLLMFFLSAFKTIHAYWKIISDWLFVLEHWIQWACPWRCSSIYFTPPQIPRVFRFSTFVIKTIVLWVDIYVYEKV